MGQLKAPDPIGNRSGEGTLAMAEKLTFE